MKTLTATSTTTKLILLAFALGMPAMNPASARADDGKQDEPADAKDDKTDKKKSDPLPPIVCDDGGDKKGDETGSPEPGLRRPQTPYDPGRCVDPTPTE